MNMDVNTKLYGLMGHPVGHSVSPALQNELIRLCGLNAVYLAWDVETAGLEEAVKGGKPYIRAESPLIIFDSNGERTEEVRDLYG